MDNKNQLNEAKNSSNETKNSSNEDINTSNIFDDFSSNDEVKEEIKKMVEESEKDLYYYLGLLKSLLQYIIIFFLVAFMFLSGYIFIQNNKNFNNSSLIDPLCFVILGDLSYVNSELNMNCSSVSSLKEQYENKLKEIKSGYLQEVNSILVDIYNIKNFINSKEVVFLKNEKESKVDIVGMLEDFDNLINKFEPTEKERISCYNIQISNDNTMKLTCEVFSAGYDERIKGFDGSDDAVGGTSLSYASSFINYIKKKSTTFSVNKEQDVFNSSSLLLENNGFTDKTKFDLELKYNSNKIIF